MIDRRQFLVGAAAAGLGAGGLAGAGAPVAAARRARTSPRPAGTSERSGRAGARAAARAHGLTLRGVTYDIGTLTLGATTRRVWSAERMRHGIAAIAGPLQCSTVTVFGSDLERPPGSCPARRSCSGSRTCRPARSTSPPPSAASTRSSAARPPPPASISPAR